VYANEIEAVLEYAQVAGQLNRYWPRLIARRSQHDSALDELRVALHFQRKQFQIVEWEPTGQDERKGEYLVRGPLNRDVFVEVKGPRWEGELKPEEIQAGRTKQPKDLYLEARAIAPWKQIQLEVDKAYEKFVPTIPNLLVIAGHRLFVSLEYGSDIHAQEALYDVAHSGFFTTPAYMNLGGVGIFWLGTDGKATWYQMELFTNRFALEPLPGDFIEAFIKGSDS